MKWTYDICKEEALKYNTRVELLNNNPSIYAKIKSNKWYELYNHMITKNSWSYNDCKEEALKYNTRNELKITNSTIYSKIKDNKWYELYNHMETTNTWTYDKCKKEALKYNSRKEMGIDNPLLYNAIRKNKWYDVCNHMEILGNKENRLIYAYEFPDNACYIGLTYNIDIRNNQHLLDKESAVYIHKEKTGLPPNLVIITGFIDTKTASKLEAEYVKQYERNGWIILNKAKAGNLGGTTIKWTYENCKKAALKYSTLTELRSNKPLYCALNRHKLLKELTSHIPRNKKEAN